MNNNQKELKILNEQILATILFIGTLLISLSITFDNKQKLKGQKRIYNDKSSRHVTIFNRIVVILVVLFFLQIDNENLDVAKEKHKSLHLLKLQKFIEFVTLGTALVALYISIKSTPSNSTASSENPNI